MQRIKEVIVVEGRYDKNTLSQVVDAVIIETGGFGIGLSIARSIAEGHRGTIRAESPDGRTIVFTAELK